MVTTIYRRASPNLPRTTPSANAYCNTLINPTMVICFNCEKNSYFTTFYLELKDTGNIKEIEKEETSNKLGKKTPRKRLPFKVFY